MQVILLSGGSGKRLWPLSNNIRSKQFLQLFTDQAGRNQSMLQRVCSQIKQSVKAPITLATNQTQVSAIKNQLGASVNVCVEPCRRDTFPAIALACAYLRDVKKVDLDECIVVCPVDPYVTAEYFAALNRLVTVVDAGKANLVLMGIEPSVPSEKFGYILPTAKTPISSVAQFKEKPATVQAAEYISQGALWNAGVFAFKLRYVLEIAAKLLPYQTYADLLQNYATLPKISFDYAVVENEKEIKVVRYHGQWSDIGTWNTLTEVLDKPIIGQGFMDGNCHQVNIVNELDLPIVAMGLQNCVIAASRDGILVANKDQVDHLKTYVENLPETIRLAEKSWGSFEILQQTANSLTAKLSIMAGKSLTNHRHLHRQEVWTILEGTGTAVVNGKKQSVKAGDVITIAADQTHSLFAQDNLRVIEVQIGVIDVHDKVKE